MKRFITITLMAVALAFLLGLLMILVLPNLSSIRPGVTIQRDHYDSLMVLQDMAVQLDEYPVAALVLYKDSIIGSGFNTFRTMNEPLGHAEINAIKSVFETMNYFDFRALSRDSLVIITSYEPCPMCKGVINHLNIDRICYLRPKKFSYRFKYGIEDRSYNLKIRRIKAPTDQ